MSKGRPKGAKDLKPRVRRSKKEIEASKLTLVPNIPLDPAITISETPKIEIGDTQPQ